MKIELYWSHFRDVAKNFLALCASGRYDNTLFHGVIRGYVIQGGDPTGKGSVSRSAYFPAQKRLPDQTHTDLSLSDGPGVVVFANSGKISAKGVGSQFFITLDIESSLHLDGTCTIVGKVIHGFDSAVAQLAEVEVDEHPYRPTDEQAARILSVTIPANPFETGDVS